MNYHLTDIQRAVRVVLDENNIDDSFIKEQDADTLTLDDIIISHIERSARIILKEAPLHLLGRGNLLPTHIEWESAVGWGVGSFKLPDDFLRLISFKMSDWDYAVHQPILDTERDYSILRSRYSGVSGNPQRPKVAICTRDSGLFLEFYSCTQGEGIKVVSANYIPAPKARKGEIELPEKLYDSIIYMIASFTAQTLNAAQQAEILANTAKSLYLQ